MEAGISYLKRCFGLDRCRWSGREASTYLRFSRGGADQAFFSIGSTSGTLMFKAAPNYEDPQDEGNDNTYVIEVEATSGEDLGEFAEQFATNRTRQEITVQVIDVLEKSATPAKPELKAVADSTTSLLMKWIEPGLNGGPKITGYNVEYRAYQRARKASGPTWHTAAPTTPRPSPGCVRTPTTRRGCGR